MKYKTVIKLPCGFRISSKPMESLEATTYYRRMLSIYRFAEVKLKWHFVVGGSQHATI